MVPFSNCDDQAIANGVTVFSSDFFMIAAHSLSNEDPTLLALKKPRILLSAPVAKKPMLFRNVCCFWSSSTASAAVLAGHFS